MAGRCLCSVLGILSVSDTSLEAIALRFLLLLGWSLFKQMALRVEVVLPRTIVRSNETDTISQRNKGLLCPQKSGDVFSSAQGWEEG